MTREPDDPFVDGVLDRLDDLEPPRILDRDARRAVMLTGMVAVVMVALVLAGLTGGLAGGLAGGQEASSGEEPISASGPSIDPASVGEALRRLKVDPAPGSKPSGLEPSEPNPATPEGIERYQSGDASAPGRRT